MKKYTFEVKAMVTVEAVNETAARRKLSSAVSNGDDDFALNNGGTAYFPVIWQQIAQAPLVDTFPVQS